MKSVSNSVEYRNQSLLRILVVQDTIGIDSRNWAGPLREVGSHVWAQHSCENNTHVNKFLELVRAKSSKNAV